MVESAVLLADIQPQAILWGGTAASWLGFDHDDGFCQTVMTRTGVPCFGTVKLINEMLTLQEVRRIGLVTPYIAALEDAIIGNYAAIGIETTAAERRDITDNIRMAAVTAEEITGMIRRVARSGPEAVIVMCTNLRGSPVTQDLTAELGIPVIDSVRAPVLELIRRL
jgi:maleate isomerase